MTTFVPTLAKSAAELVMWLTFREAAISEGLVGSGGPLTEDNFVFGKGGHNKIVVLVIVVAIEYECPKLRSLCHEVSTTLR